MPSETIQLKTLFGHQLTFSFGIAKIFNIAHNGDSVTNVALDWILENNRSSVTIICSDSLSLITSIVSRQVNIRDITEKLQLVKGRVVIQWVQSHYSHILGNESADRYTKEIAKSGEPQNTSISYNTARAIIKRDIKDSPPSHPIVTKTYEL